MVLNLFCLFAMIHEKKTKYLNTELNLLLFSTNFSIYWIIFFVIIIKGLSLDPTLRVNIMKKKIIN